MEHQATSNHETVTSNGVDYGLTDLEQRSQANVSRCRNHEKLRVLKARSADALVMLIREGAESDFVYVDGSHVAIDVLHDAVLAWRLLAAGGTLVFDDYTWRGYLEDRYNPRMAIQAFVRCVEDEVRAVETESQMWLTRVPCVGAPMPNPDEAQCYRDDPRWELNSPPSARASI